MIIKYSINKLTRKTPFTLCCSRNRESESVFEVGSRSREFRKTRSYSGKNLDGRSRTFYLRLRRFYWKCDFSLSDILKSMLIFERNSWSTTSILIAQETYCLVKDKTF